MDKTERAAKKIYKGHYGPNRRKISMCETIEIVEQLVFDKQLAEYEEQRADES